MVLAVKSYEIREYVLGNGESPYRKWMVKLSAAIRARISARIFRFEQGNIGDAKQLDEGVWEARFTFGPGYRLYFAIDKGRLILLLLGGDKSSQSKDIKKAKQYWQDYREETSHE